jgi:metal-sulfur cluster biosynthetic enzyme
MQAKGVWKCKRPIEWTSALEDPKVPLQVYELGILHPNVSMPFGATSVSNQCTLY